MSGPRSPRAAGPETVWVALAAALGAAYVYLLGSGGGDDTAPLRAMGRWDLETYFFPKFVAGARTLLDGHLPVWTPYEFGGAPLLASAQGSSLYLPMVLLFGLLPLETAFPLYFLLHLVLMAVFFALFARHQRLGALAVACGALSYGFSRAVLATSGHPIGATVFTWLPLIFLFGDRLCRGFSWSTFLGLAFTVAIQLLAGYPAAVLDCGLLIALHATTIWLLDEDAAAPWRSVPLLALGFFAGAALSAIQLLPTGELVVLSRRLEMAQDVVARTADVPFGWHAFTLFGNGILGFLVLAVAGLGRKARVPLVGLLFCAFVVLGGWKLLRLLPLFAGMRQAGSWALSIQFYLAWLVACGVDQLAQPGWAKALPRRLVLASGAAILVVFYVAAGSEPSFLPGAAQRWWGFPNPLVGLLGGLGAAGLLLIAARPPHPRWLWPICALLVLAHVSAFPFGEQGVFRGAPTLRGRSSALLTEEQRAEGRIFSIVDARGGYPSLLGFEGTSGREGSLPSPRIDSVERALGVSVPLTQFDWKRLRDLRGLLDTLDARYVVLPNRPKATLSDAGYEALKPAAGARWRAHQAREPLGRSWVAYGASVLPSDAQARETLLSSTFDARHQVLVERPLERDYPSTSRFDPTPARAERLSPTHTRVAVDAPRPGILVLADACFPGWEATVDGASAPHFCANYLARGVEIDTGPHTIDFRYRPWSVRVGMAISIAALVLAAAVLLWDRRRRWPGAG